MLENYQSERVKLMKEILPLFGENFILKGGTALSLFYGLNRYSEDLDFDCISSNMDFINRLKYHKEFKNWNINIKKKTDTVFRAMIDYGATSHYGSYPLKIEVSSRNKELLRSGGLKLTYFDEVLVYHIDELIVMKAVAFNGRDKIRDLFDLNFLLDKYPNHFDKNTLFSISQKLDYNDCDELNLLLQDEIKKHKLVSNIDFSGLDIDNFAQNMSKKIQKLYEDLSNSQTFKSLENRQNLINQALNQKDNYKEKMSEIYKKIRNGSDEKSSNTQTDKNHKKQ